MCLSAAYEVKNGDENLVCEHVTAINLESGVVKLVDIMGEEITIAGMLRSVDLIKNIVKIDV